MKMIMTKEKATERRGMMLVTIAQDDYDRLKQIEEAASTVLKGFSEGVFCRSTDKDHESGWAVKLLPYVAALGALQKVLASTPESALKASQHQREYIQRLEAVVTDSGAMLDEYDNDNVSSDLLVTAAALRKSLKALDSKPAP